MQTRSRARDLELNEEVEQEGHQHNRRDLPHQGNESRNRQLPPREEQVEEERGEGEFPPLVPHPPQLHLKSEVLQCMIEDASTRAAERAINHFMENRQREPSPLRSPRRGRGTSTPEDNKSRENGS
ncbi:UNVERIFIED_CONTAM: hypothetical protein Sradi_3152900 [Sesamum radiatum]|uniref:Uncharacterized protein n=1 Tax=Sesamum radiatum TaxID=300843 RepID=A0AAW2REK3_SESRA